MPAAIHAVAGIGFIRVDVGARYHVVLYEALKGVPVRALYLPGDSLSGGAVHQAPHSRLARGTAPGTQALVGMLVAVPAPEAGLSSSTRAAQSGSASGSHASRMRCSMNQAAFRL